MTRALLVLAIGSVLMSSHSSDPDCPCLADFGVVVVNSTECTLVSASFTTPATNGECPAPLFICHDMMTEEPCKFTYSISITAASTPPDCCGSAARALHFSYGNLEYGPVQIGRVDVPPIPLSLPFAYGGTNQTLSCYKFEFYQFEEVSTCPPVDPASGVKHTILLQFSKNCADCAL